MHLNRNAMRWSVHFLLSSLRRLGFLSKSLKFKLVKYAVQHRPSHIFMAERKNGFNWPFFSCQCLFWSSIMYHRPFHIKQKPNNQPMSMMYAIDHSTPLPPRLFTSRRHDREMYTPLNPTFLSKKRGVGLQGYTF